MTINLWSPRLSFDVRWDEVRNWTTQISVYDNTKICRRTDKLKYFMLKESHLMTSLDNLAYSTYWLYLSDRPPLTLLHVKSICNNILVIFRIQTLETSAERTLVSMNKGKEPRKCNHGMCHCLFEIGCCFCFLLTLLSSNICYTRLKFSSSFWWGTLCTTLCYATNFHRSRLKAQLNQTKVDVTSKS